MDNRGTYVLESPHGRKTFWRQYKTLFEWNHEMMTGMEHDVHQQAVSMLLQSFRKDYGYWRNHGIECF